MMESESEDRVRVRVSNLRDGILREKCCDIKEDAGPLIQGFGLRVTVRVRVLFTVRVRPFESYPITSIRLLLSKCAVPF